MLSVEEWTTVKVLHKRNPGMSLREIGRLVKCSHNTVKAALAKQDYKEYQRSPKVNPQLECFHDYIRDQRTVKHLKGTRIFSDRKSKGYTGGKIAFYSFLKQLEEINLGAKGAASGVYFAEITLVSGTDVKKERVKLQLLK